MIGNYQSLRLYLSKFCSDREWEVFHTPLNLVLALAGECGEVCEVFQWKNNLTNIKSELSAKEYINLGEEIADVFVYSTRLSDMCGIDLAKSVKYWSRNLTMTENNDHTMLLSCRSELECEWDDLNLDFTVEFESALFLSYPRLFILKIVSVVGRLCDMFLTKLESDFNDKLSFWSEEEVAEVSKYLACICILLSQLAQLVDHKLSVVISDKIKKNELKYPANLVKGSSAKYTQYKNLS